MAIPHDSVGRHVALGSIKKNSDEFKIVQVLIQESSLLSLEDFPGVYPI